MIRVSNKKEAWRLANVLFPTDYVKDEKRSENAGYGIYFSTANNTNAWISDLNDRLELNYPNGSSENIWIDCDEEITFQKLISTINRNTQIEVFVDMYGMKFSTTHYAEYYLEKCDSEISKLLGKIVTDMMVSEDGVMKVMLK